MIPAALKAHQDRRLRGAPREIYFWLHERLDVVQFRRMSLGQIVLGTGIHRNTVHIAVHRLVQCGYLDRRRGGGREYEYRLFHAPE